MKGKLLIICSTHGDEKVGIEVVERLKNKGLSSKFDWVIANPLALEQGVRFVDTDLNRSYPGNIDSLSQEERRAVKIKELWGGYS